MGLHVWKRWLVINGALALLAPAVLVSPASADDEEVARRLGKYGKLSGGEARNVVSNVSGRMKRAADMTSNSDPLRSAVSSALYGSPVPADAMASAKIRLRLYAGLNEWALDSLFAPRPGALATCTNQFGLSAKDCQALLAASGRMSPAEASRLGGGKPIATATAAAPVQQQRPVYAPAPQPMQQQSRFGGRYDSGFRGAPQQQQQGYAPAQRPAYGPAPAQGYSAPARPAYGGYGAAQPAYATQPARPMPPQGYGAARPMPVARPMPAPVARPMPAPRPVMAPPASPQMVANRKAEYERKRQEYLERKKAEMAARKQKIVATAGGTAPVQRGPTSAAEAEAVGLDPATVAKRAPEPTAKAPAKGASAKGAAATAAVAEPEEVAQAPSEAKSEKPALDGDFLNGLMDNPLGDKK
jgi:hypothetical protein